MHLKLPLIKPPDRERRIQFLAEAVTYRMERSVTQIVRYPTYGYCYPLCPRCRSSLEREYVAFCDRCGQKLSWDRFCDAKILDAPLTD